MAVWLVTGQPGHGKTYFVVGHLLSKLTDSETRPKYVDGIPELTTGWEPCEGAKWTDLPDNSIVIIDEAQRIFRPRGVGSAVPPHVAALETHRHRGFDIVIITQHAKLIDSNVRRLVGEHFHVRRPLGQSWANVYRWDHCEEELTDSSIDHSTKEKIVFKASVWSQYKSATAHMVKARYPWQVFALIPLAVLVGVGIWYGVKAPAKAVTTLTGKEQSKGAQQVTEAAKQGPSGNVAPGLKVKPFDPDLLDEKRERYLAKRLPLVLDQPESAERYHALTQPKIVPAVRACAAVFWGEHWECRCYYPNGSPQPVSEAACWRHIREGTFHDWEAPGRTVSSSNGGNRSTISGPDGEPVVVEGAPSAGPVYTEPPKLPLGVSAKSPAVN